MLASMPWWRADAVAEVPPRALALVALECAASCIRVFVTSNGSVSSTSAEPATAPARSGEETCGESGEWKRCAHTYTHSMPRVTQPSPRCSARAERVCVHSWLRTCVRVRARRLCVFEKREGARLDGGVGAHERTWRCGRSTCATSGGTVVVHRLSILRWLDRRACSSSILQDLSCKMLKLCSFITSTCRNG